MFRLVLLAVLITCTASAEAVKKNEAYYQAIAAQLLRGRTEVVMPDKTRCDIVTETHAIEVDWSHKHFEAIGQSLNYAFQKRKLAGIVLIIDNANDTKDALRINSLIKHYELPITLWVLMKDSETLKRF